MSRALFEAVPVTTEIELRLRRLEERIARVEATAHAAAVPPGPTATAAPPAPAPTTPTTAPVDARWAALATRLDALALKLKVHYEQAGGDGVPRAVDDLRDSLRQAFAAAGTAIDDDAVRADVREVGVMVAEALADGLTTVGSDLRDALHRDGTATQR